MVSSIVLAAGMSTRMGKQNKLLLKINRNTIIKETINNILASNVVNCTLVLGHEHELLIKELYKLKINIVVNKDYKKGMGASVRAGINSLGKETKAVMICLGDMPLIKTSTYNKLILSIKNYDHKRIILPLYNSVRGNPVIFSHHYFKELKELNGDTGAKDIINNNKKFLINVNIKDSGIISDFDTNNDYNNYINEL